MSLTKKRIKEEQSIITNGLDPLRAVHVETICGMAMRSLELECEKAELIDALSDVLARCESAIAFYAENADQWQYGVENANAVLRKYEKG